MISVLSFEYLYWSSSWQWQAHIRGCKLLRPLPRAEMSDFGPVFRKMYFLWVWWSPQKILVQIFWVLPPKTGYFAQPSENSLPLCRNWGSTETTININDRLICPFLGRTPISAWNPNSRKAMTGALYMLNRDHNQHKWSVNLPIPRYNPNFRKVEFCNPNSRKVTIPPKKDPFMWKFVWKLLVKFF